MSIYNQENMIKERSSVNGIIGLASINPSNNLHKYSSVNPLLENGSRRTILLDFINKKFIIGDNPPPIYTFKGKMDYDNNIMRMDVWIEHKGKEHKLLIDTGTLYSQFLETGPIELSGYPLRAFPYGIPFPPIINRSSNGIKLWVSSPTFKTAELTRSMSSTLRRPS